MLLAAAANEWKVNAASCRVKQGGVLHVPSGRGIAYSQLIERAAELVPPAKPALKPQSEFTLIGTTVRRTDTPEKVIGRAIYGIDVRVYLFRQHKNDDVRFARWRDGLLNPRGVERGIAQNNLSVFQSPGVAVNLVPSAYRNFCRDAKLVVNSLQNAAFG
jgi:hypothetical protein